MCVCVYVTLCACVCVCVLCAVFALLRFLDFVGFAAQPVWSLIWFLQGRTHTRTCVCLCAWLVNFWTWVVVVFLLLFLFCFCLPTVVVALHVFVVPFKLVFNLSFIFNLISYRTTYLPPALFSLYYTQVFLLKPKPHTNSQLWIHAHHIICGNNNLSLNTFSVGPKKVKAKS